MTFPKSHPSGFEKGRLSKHLGKVGAYLVVLAASAIMILPYLWMISTSLKDMEQAFAYPPRWLPDPAIWANFVTIFQKVPLARYMWNTLVIAVLATVGAMLSASMTGFAVARLRWPGRDLFFTLLLATLMIPAQVTMIPRFVIMKNLGWVDTFLPLIVPHFLGQAFGVFLMRQFFLSLPGELLDAARIDGCSHVGALWRIYLPLSAPALAVVGVFTFMSSWNDLLDPLIYLNSTDKFTLSIGLAFFRGQYGQTEWPLLMAAAFVSIVPMIVLYIFAQRYFVEGIATAGLKR
jgi:ABC-type glycerol-3-phosphate transport system permease component